MDNNSSSHFPNVAHMCPENPYLSHGAVGDRLRIKRYLKTTCIFAASFYKMFMYVRFSSKATKVHIVAYIITTRLWSRYLFILFPGCVTYQVFSTIVSVGRRKRGWRLANLLKASIQKIHAWLTFLHSMSLLKICVKLNLGKSHLPIFTFAVVQASLNFALITAVKLL